MFRLESLGYQVNHLARLMAVTLRGRIEPLGVAPGQFPQLLALYEQDALTQAELCDRVQVEQPTMANTLARMERDGLIERLPDPDDRRRSRVVLTPKARGLRDDLLAAAREVNSIATVGLNEHEAEAFLTAVSTAVGNLTLRETRQRRPSASENPR